MFDARGLLGYEARLQADIRVTTLPEGLDPDEVVNRDPQEWENILAAARPIVIHVMETLAKERDLDDPKVKSEIAAQVLPLIEDVPSPIERDTYRQRLARLLRVDERALYETAPVRAKPAPTRRTSPQKTSQVLEPTKDSVYRQEEHCLGILLRRPAMLYQVDRQLLQAGLARLMPEDFQHGDHASIVRLFQESVDQDIADPLNFVMNNLSLAMMDLADQLLEHTTEMDPNDDRVMEDLMRGLLDLRKRRLRQQIEYLRFLMEEAQDQGDLKATQVTQTMVQHTQTLRQINKAVGNYTGRSGKIH